MKVVMDTFNNGDCKIVIREDGAIAARGYGLVQFGNHLVSLGSIAESCKARQGDISWEEFKERFVSLREALALKEKGGGVPFAGAPHYASNFTAEYEGEDDGSLSFIPRDEFENLIARLDVNQ